GLDFANTTRVGDLAMSGTIKYYYFLLAVLVVVIVINLRLQNSRIGRAWEAIREDELAARAMGIKTGNIWGVVLGAILLSFVPEILRYTVGADVQQRIFGRSLIDPEVIRMLLFGLAMVVMMLFRPAGIL